MGKAASRLYRSSRAVFRPSQPATRHAVKAQEKLVQSVSDNEVTGHDETVQKNLKSLYIHTTTRDTKDQRHQSQVKIDHSSGISADDLLLMFHERRKNEMKWTSEKVATDYKLSLSDAENLLRYFNNFVIVKTIPPPKSSPLQDNPYSID